MRIDENLCLSTKLNGAISIRALKRFAAKHDTGAWKKYCRKLQPTGKKVAIVGSGPAGLTAAYYLAKQGHSVTVFEANSKPGGMMRYGIPDYRLPKEILEKEIREIEDAGVKIQTDIRVASLYALFKQGFQAVFLAVGAQKGMKLGVEGENDPGVIDGISFLGDTKTAAKTIPGKTVAVIGGGNVAIDVALTALRLGARQVNVVCLEHTIEEMPAFTDEITQAKDEGVKIDMGWGVNRILTGNGKLDGVELTRCVSVYDDFGKFKPCYAQNELKKIAADLVIVAIGQMPDIPDTFAVKTNANHTLQVEPKTLAADREGVWAGGDAVTGPASVIEAIAAGRKAAVSIDKYLGGKGKIDEKLTRVRRVIAPETEEYPEGSIRAAIPLLPIEKRTGNFSETEMILPENAAVGESERCLHCGDGITSRCRYACPAGINVPLYVNLIKRGKYEDALAVIREKVPFPGVLGRVCNAPCEDACTGCAMCVPFCPMNAINANGDKKKEVKIDFDECADCGVCFRARICPVDAIVDEVYQWPRSVRSAFSNPLVLHKETRVPGRGTEEVKTNEVTGQFRKGYVGVTAELGRPGVGARFRDVEKVAQALARAHVVFAANNPVTHMMTDKTTGKLNDEILNEKVCSAMIETTSPLENLPDIIKELREVAAKLDTVFSLTISSRLDEDGTAPCRKILKELNVPLYLNGKTNLGLGRPLFKEESK